MSSLLVALLGLATTPVSAGTPVPTPDVSAVLDDSEPSEVATVLIGAPLRAPALDLPEPVRAALRRGQWAKSAELLGRLGPDAFTGSDRGDWAFLLAWSHIHTDHPERALPLVPLLEHTTAPSSYIALVRGELYRSQDDGVEALRWLERVPPTSSIYPRAAVQRAEVLRELKRTQEAFALYEELVQRPDPAAGNPEALLALARRHGAGAPEAYPHLRRVWAQYPRSEHSVEAAKLLKSYSGSAYAPSWQDVSARAERLMYQGAHKTALAETAPRLAEASDDSMAACRMRYVRGRSAYKLNQLTNAVAGFGDAGTRCVDAEGAYGPRSLYLQGTAEFRRRRYASSAAAYRILADSYSDHSMADDALTRGGISLQEGGDLAKAQAWWREALERFPEGDTVPEATWRLAFSLYLEGKPDAAVETARALGALPLASNRRHVLAGRYWSARWLLYPNVDAPTVAVDDPEARAAAIEGFRSLCVDNPRSYYALLAYGRLRELAPELAAQLAQRPEGHDRGDLSRPWVVRQSYLESPAIRDGVALARLGLIAEARQEWRVADVGEHTPDEVAWQTELRIGAGDWLYAHDHLRDWLEHHPVGTLGSREAQVVRVAYPDRYWENVQAAAPSYRYDPRLFHALVREESNFNRTIVSFAGARGLSQLMPPTARQTAGWLGMTIQMSDLDDPDTNLKIGAKYLDAMHKQLDDSPYLSLAAYNAGAARVSGWMGDWGNLPTDEFVERIPFRETRGYVKRVSDTWQTMRWQFDEGEAFADLSAFNHKALPDH